MSDIENSNVYVKGNAKMKRKIYALILGGILVSNSPLYIMAEDEYLENEYIDDYSEEDYVEEEYISEGYSEEDYASDDAYETIRYNSMEQLLGGIPVWSPEYIDCYINDRYDIELGKIPKKIKKTIEKCNKFEELIPIKEEDNMFKGDYYAITKDRSDLYYAGELDDGRPDGIGAIYKEYEVYDRRLMRSVYKGEFKDGIKKGFGISYKDTELDYDETTLISYVVDDKDAQKVLDEFFTPILYSGDFKKNQATGDGVQFVYPNMYELAYLMKVGATMAEIDKTGCFNGDILITYGEFKNGMADGDVLIYNKGKVIYDGEMSDGEIDGKGKLYYPDSDQLKYKGEFKNNKYHGKGKEYSESGKVLYSGEWRYGDYES